MGITLAEYCGQHLDYRRFANPITGFPEDPTKGNSFVILLKRKDWVKVYE
jgi:hypothetical protein